MTEKNDAQAAANARSIVVSRTFDAPCELVFEAWTDPKHFARWWGPNGFSTTTSAFDFRPGGIWRFVMHGPDGRNYQNRITWDEIVRPERLVYHHGGGDDVEPVQFRTTVTFEDLGGKTRLTMRAVFPSVAKRDRVVREYGAEEGARQTIARLAEYLAQMEAAKSAARELVITRVFDAPRSLVFRAWTDPQHVALWWGPKGFTNPVCEMDVRPGGALRIVMRAPDGVEYPMTGVFREIVAPERLVFTNVAVDQAGKPLLEGLTTVTFAEHGGKTKLTLQTRAVALVAQAARFLEGMEAGWTQSLDRLEAYLAMA